jgi:hypothetical protein
MRGTAAQTVDPELAPFWLSRLRTASRPAEGNARTRTQIHGLGLTAFCTRIDKKALRRPLASMVPS